MAADLHPPECRIRVEGSTRVIEGDLGLIREVVNDAWREIARLRQENTKLQKALAKRNRRLSHQQIAQIIEKFRRDAALADRARDSGDHIEWDAGQAIRDCAAQLSALLALQPRAQEEVMPSEAGKSIRTIADASTDPANALPATSGTVTERPCPPPVGNINRSVPGDVDGSASPPPLDLGPLETLVVKWRKQFHTFMAEADPLLGMNEQRRIAGALATVTQARIAELEEALAEVRRLRATGEQP